jgi:barstar (barnase inhibitor)
MGFPEGYGRNMDAWIDCLTYRDEADGMSSVNVKPGEVLTLQINGYAEFKKHCPDVAEALLESAAFVNFRRLETDDPPILVISFHP